MSKEESGEFMEKVHRLQPDCLVSSRVGNGLGDFKDFGDGEIPPGVVKGAWEAIFTHNDSWGYSAFDQNFKSPREIIHMLAEVASKGGNLMVNIGPDGKGRILAHRNSISGKPAAGSRRMAKPSMAPHIRLLRRSPGG